MGAVCSCLPLEDLDEHDDGTNTSRSPINCFGLRVSFPGVFHLYNSLFRRENAQVIPSSVQSTSFSSTSSMDSSLAEVYRSVPLPLPYDVDPRHCCMHQERLSPRHDKGTSDSRDESEPLRISDPVRDSEPLIKGDKSSKSSCEEAIKQNCKSSKKLPSVKPVIANEYFYTSTEDEDVCPTCLEEYTEENPKIVTKCSHHYHLGCIYEWMERSERCPVCGKVMAFDEFI